jgi:hypothetical protein
LRCYNVGIIDGGDLWCTPLEMSSCGMIYISSFMKTGERFQELLWFVSEIW